MNVANPAPAPNVILPVSNVSPPVANVISPGPNSNRKASSPDLGSSPNLAASGSSVTYSESTRDGQTWTRQGVGETKLVSQTNAASENSGDGNSNYEWSFANSTVFSSTPLNDENDSYDVHGHEREESIAKRINKIGCSSILS